MHLTDEVAPMGARCDRCDTELEGSDEAVETVDRGCLCVACADETGAEALPDVTEPGSWEVNEYVGEAPVDERGMVGAVGRMSRAGWWVFGAGVLAVAPPLLWREVSQAGGVGALWWASGYTVLTVLVGGVVLWLALCVVMFPD